MTNETKNALYSLLDLMDSIGTISFVKLDVDKVNLIRKEILDIINGKDDLSINALNTTYSELLGILPMMLLDDNKFKTTKDILYFADKCLMIDIKDYWYKRSRSEIIGIILVEVSKQKPNQLNKFLRAWDAFNQHSIINERRNINNNPDESYYLETWFKFFENYKDNL